MIVDTSALIAIFQSEPEREQFLQIIEQTGSIKVSSATLLEAGIVVMARNDQIGVDRFHELLSQLNIEEVPFNDEHRKNAIEAFAKYGKGKNNKAQLNFGDCFTYGLAKSLDEPLLCKGNDFVYTDLKTVY